MGSPIHAQHLPGKEPDGSPRLHIAERWHSTAAPSWHRGIPIISRLQEKPPKKSPPSPPLWASGLGRQKTAQLLPNMQPLRCGQSTRGGRGRQLCLPPAALPAPGPSSHLSRFTAVPATSASRAWLFAQRSQKEEVPLLKSEPRQTPSILPFGWNLEGLFVKPASAPRSPLHKGLDPAPKGQGKLSPLSCSHSSAGAMAA